MLAQFGANVARAGREQIVSNGNCGKMDRLHLRWLLAPCGCIGQIAGMKFSFRPLIFLALSQAAYAQDAGISAEVRPQARSMIVATTLESSSPRPDDFPQSSLRPKRRDGDDVPRARWDHRPAGRIWTRAAIAALQGHGRPILDVVPRDIADWCPAYPEADTRQRAAFWAGFMSALAKHESTYRQDAVGGNGRWYGLLQILPATARGYKCASPSREGLKHGPSNLSCAVRILTVVMPRDTVMARKDKRWRGVAADWGPMRVASKRKDISAWTRQQSYCRTLGSVRPQLRPE